MPSPLLYGELLYFTGSNKGVLSVLSSKTGEPLDFDKLARDLVRLNQLGDFASVGFRLEPEGEKNKLVVEARQKPWGPGYVRFGM